MEDLEEVRYYGTQESFMTEEYSLICLNSVLHTGGYSLFYDYHVGINKASLLKRLTKVATIRMIRQDIESNQDNVNDPPNTAKTSRDELQNSEENVAKVESVDTFEKGKILATKGHNKNHGSEGFFYRKGPRRWKA